MRFERPIFRLPIQFDAEALAVEVRALPPSAWVPHPDGFKGNDAVRLISPGGQPVDGWQGVMAPTEHLRACRYIMELMAELGGVWGRSRLMGLAAGAEVPAHIDSHYYWRTHLRIHIPVITNPAVEFTCGAETVHMAPGECWVFDSFQKHEVHNRGSEHRIHLVLDAVGGGRLPELFRLGQEHADGAPQELNPGEREAGPLHFECLNMPKVMSPWEIRCHVRFLADRAQPHALLETLLERLERFIDEWAALWARYGDSDNGLSSYRQLLDTTGRDLTALGGEQIELQNGLPFFLPLHRLVFEVALAPVQPPRTQAPTGFVTARQLAS